MGLFDFFSRGKAIYRPSLYFLNHALKDMYFYRTMQFEYLDNNTIYALDPRAPRVLTFDPWPQQVFLSATGKITVYDFLIEMAGKYRGNVPELLDKTIINELEKLINEGVINVCNEPFELEPAILNPVERKR